VELAITETIEGLGAEFCTSQLEAIRGAERTVQQSSACGVVAAESAAGSDGFAGVSSESQAGQSATHLGKKAENAATGTASTITSNTDATKCNRNFIS
jgi:hypothetical protein